MSLFRTIGHSLAFAGGSLAQGATLGQVERVNGFAADQASKTAESAAHFGAEVASTARCAGHAAAFAGLAVATGATLGQATRMHEAMTEQGARAVENAAPVVKVLDDVSASVPVLGHARGVAHYLAGDWGAGTKCMKSASHTTGALLGSAAGLLVDGPCGACYGAVVGGQLVEGVATGVESGLRNQFTPNGAICNTVQAVRVGWRVDQAIIDGATEMAFDAYGGKALREALRPDPTRVSAAPAPDAGGLQAVGKGAPPYPVRETAWLALPGERSVAKYFGGKKALGGKRAAKAIAPAVMLEECAPGLEDVLGALDDSND